MSYTWEQVVAWLGVVIPLSALAWAAVQHVLNERRERQHAEYSKFFDIMRKFGAEESTVPGNMAAAYELRRFPQYSEVIIRLAEDAPLIGGSAELLKHELLLTADFLRAKQ